MSNNSDKLNAIAEHVESAFSSAGAPNSNLDPIRKPAEEPKSSPWIQGRPPEHMDDSYALFPLYHLSPVERETIETLVEEGATQGWQEDGKRYVYKEIAAKWLSSGLKAPSYSFDDFRHGDKLFTSLAEELYDAVVEEKLFSSKGIWGFFHFRYPWMDNNKRVAIAELAQQFAFMATSNFEKMLEAVSDSSDQRGIIEAFAMRERWASQDLWDCLDGLPDDTTKEATRRNEIEALRNSLDGAAIEAFGRLF